MHKDVSLSIVAKTASHFFIFYDTIRHSDMYFRNFSIRFWRKSQFSIGNGPFTGYECKGYYVLYGLQKKKFTDLVMCFKKK